VYGREIPLAELLSQAPKADEDWIEDEPTRFGRYARRLWDGLLAAEVVGDR
jgi:exodeoxyribonuclease V gamma subunit